MTELLKRKQAVDQIKKMSKTPIEKISSIIDPKSLIPTGSTLLNLALSDTPFGGFAMGKIANIIGDNAAGKTLLALTILAEICQDKRFDKYELLFDDTEVALEFDIKKIFGKRTAKRIRTDIRSKTIQDWYSNHLKFIKQNIPFIYVTDSFDGLTSDEELKRAKKRIEPDEESSKKGSYKTEKAKWASEAFRVFAEGLENTNSLSLIISQTRDNIGVMFGPKKIMSGGSSIKFWRCHEVWLAIRNHIKSNAHKDIEIGTNVIVKVKKNKLTGKRRTVNFAIYDDYGIDDIRSCIDFLLEQNHWTKKTGTITSFDMDLVGTIDYLISEIEKENRENELIKIVADVWYAIEQDIKLNRKPKYT